MLQNAFFGDIKRLRFRLITRHAQAPPLDDPHRMVFFGHYGDMGPRQLFLGCAHHSVCAFDYFIDSAGKLGNTTED
jgi:hypothetical protein